MAAPGRIRGLLADEDYGAGWLRADLRNGGIMPVIPAARSRKRPIRPDMEHFKDRWRTEAVLCRLRHVRRVATRYDKLAGNFDSAVALAASWRSGAEWGLTLADLSALAKLAPAVSRLQISVVGVLSVSFFSL